MSEQHPGKEALIQVMTAAGRDWGVDVPPRVSGAMMVNIASYVSDLEARLEKARKVIEPFGKLAGEPITITAHGSTRAPIDTDNFRAARAWMEQDKS